MTTAANDSEQSEVGILARVLGNETEPLPNTIARYILHLGFSEKDQNRMHELAERNQEGALSHAEKQELGAYAKAASLLSILKSKARRALHIKVTKRSTS